MRKKLKTIFVALLFLTGLSVLLYPLISNQWNSYRQSKLISEYTQNVRDQDEEKSIDYEQQWEMAKAYNENLKPMILPDSFAIAEISERDEIYMACLNLNGNEIMGIVEIPKIKVKIPIYHTTNEEVLQLGAGHLEGSSLPIGGEGNHAVISAHRGLPSASLFTDLDKLEKGDHFLLHILDDILCYEVDQVNVIEPEDTKCLSTEDGKDLVTLLTCTPYGVNSHRLVVRGHRVPYVPEEVHKENTSSVMGVSLHTNYLFWVILGLTVTGSFIVFLYFREKRIRKRRKLQKDKKVRNILYLLFFVIGAGVMFYPTITELWNSYRNQQLVSSYTKAVENMEPEDFSAVWEEARAFNAQHTVNSIVDAFDEEKNDYVLSHPYDQILNPDGNEIMGYIEIPKINVRMAIYHGIGTEALENGCGHIEGTSLPIGGAGTHAVLSAHRGLPSAKLFTDLDQLEIGDIFFIKVLDAKLAYKVDQILTVLPEETDSLAIEPGKDLITLVTCTPYGVNSHRILVRGERTEYVEEEDTMKPGIILRNPLEGTDGTKRLLTIGLMTFLLFMIILWIILKISDWKKAKKRKRREGNHVEKKS